MEVVNDDFTQSGEFGECSINLKYTSFYACPRELPVAFLNHLTHWMAAIGIIFSLVMIFYGKKFIVQLTTLAVGIFFGGLVMYISYYYFGLQSREKEGQLYMALIFSFIFSIVAMIRFTLRFKGNVIWLLGTLIGAQIGRLISMPLVVYIKSKFLEDRNFTDYVEYSIETCTIVGMLFGFFVGFKFK